MSQRPIVILGGGVAGLAAAETLRAAGVSFLLVDGAPRLGGRWATDDLGADIGCPAFSRRDATLMALVRRVGLDSEVVTIQAPVLRRRADGILESTPHSFDAARVTLRRGMGNLAAAWERELVGELVATPVSAIRWLDDARCFILRHAITGESVRHPLTRERIEARGVVIATDAAAARLIAENSRPLAPLVPALQRVRTGRAVVGSFRVPRVEARWAMLECEPGGDIDWFSLEDRKAPTRVAEGESLLVARASWRLAEELHHPTPATIARLYAACRDRLPELPLHPLDARLHVWTSAWPLDDSFVDVPDAGLPTDPPGLAVALAGDYTAGPTAELAAQSGVRAARQVLARC